MKIQYKHIALLCIVTLFVWVDSNSQNLLIDTSFKSGDGFNTTDFLGSPKAIALQSNNKLIIGGQFSKYNNTDALGIVRLDKDGNIDTTFKPPLSGIYVITDIITQPDDKILISGDFKAVPGSKSNGIIRLEKDGNIDTTFESLGIANGIITDLDVDSQNRILVAGNFDSFNNHRVNKICRIYNTGQLDTTFNCTEKNDFWVNCIFPTKDQKILVGGTGAFRLHNDGSIDTTFNSPFNNSVYQFTELFNQQLIISGDNSIAKTDSNGNIDSTFIYNYKGPRGPIRTFIRLFNGNFIVGGWLTDANDPRNNPILLLDANGKQIDSFNVKFNDYVHKIIRYDSNSAIVIGGFKSANDIKSNRISKIIISDSKVDFHKINKNIISIFPNPTHGKIEISGMQLKQLIVRKMDGSILIHALNLNNNQFDLSSLNSGMYVIELIDDQSYSKFQLLQIK